MARTVLGKNPIYFKFAQKDFSDSDKAPNASFYTRMIISISTLIKSITTREKHMKRFDF